MGNFSIPQTNKALAVYFHGKTVPMLFAVFAAILAAVAGFVLYLSTTIPQKTLTDTQAMTLRNGAVGYAQQFDYFVWHGGFSTAARRAGTGHARDNAQAAEKPF